MSFLDAILGLIATAFVIWGVNYSISAHFQEDDKDVWFQHGIAAIFFLIAVFLVILTGA